MRLLKDQAGTFKEDIQLEIGAGKLGFSVASAAAALTDANIALMKVRAVYHGPNGNTDLFPKMKITDLFEHSVHDEGYYTKKKTLLTGTVDLSAFGSLVLTNGYLSISYEGFPDDAVTNIYAIDGPARTNIAQKIEEVIVQGTKEVNLLGRTRLAFPANAELDEVQIQYADKNCTLTLEELKIINRSINDLVFVADSSYKSTLEASVDDVSAGVQYGFGNLLFLEVAEAYSMIVKTVDNNPIRIYLTQNLGV